MSERYTKDFLMHELAARANFTVGDVKILWNTFEEIVEECVADHDELMIGGLFKLYYHKIEPHIGYSLATGKEEQRGVGYRLTIKPSTTLKNILKNTREVLPKEEE